jgi:hypothetical protein
VSIEAGSAVRHPLYPELGRGRVVEIARSVPPAARVEWSTAGQISTHALSVLREFERYFHGGAPGLRPGDVIEPQPLGEGKHLVDGCPTCDARKAGQQLPTDDLDPHLVYVTTDREYARLYAAGYPHGALYVVDPLGDLTPSPDPAPSWGCTAARVTGVYDAYVVLSPSELRRIQRQFMGGMR